MPNGSAALSAEGAFGTHCAGRATSLALERCADRDRFLADPLEKLVTGWTLADDGVCCDPLEAGGRGGTAMGGGGGGGGGAI